MPTNSPPLAQRLWQYSGRGLDTYGLRNACEAAAAAGNALADRVRVFHGKHPLPLYIEDIGRLNAALQQLWWRPWPQPFLLLKR